MNSQSLFAETKRSAVSAQYEAQRIAFAPVVFQCVRVAWKRGLLDALAAAGKHGLIDEQLAEVGKLSRYAISVLLETALSAGVVSRDGDRWVLTKTGHFVATDPLFRVNADFVHDVCYVGLADLEASLEQEKPIGLKTLGDWPTLYEGLSILPEPAKTSWFNFDHHYSDSAFPDVLPQVFATKPKRLMDIGANTGKFSRMCLLHDNSLQVTMLDLPVQLNVARKTLTDAGVIDRAIPHEIDLLDESAPFPGGQDVVWMSQFLCCFSEANIRSILARARAALAEGGRVLVLDTFWDRQRHEVAAYCLINTSPYFTAIASGNSKMYESRAFIDCARDVGLRLTDVRDGLGLSHSLLSFSPE
ncbi:class I SAM-dependent methyltransferase [Niveibacterium sp.]|uniref:class I SAM-dependent methyltransferase n=1 Tax=Niveibacterium sp. TaxID=2017444 RepID=UPI0035B38C62